MMKDTSEEIPRARDRRAPSAGAPHPMDLGCVTIPSTQKLSYIVG